MSALTQCPRCGASLTPKQRPLTKRQAEVLTYLRDYITVHGYAPNFEEIASALSLSSLSTVYEHLNNLARKGYITREYNACRAIALVESGPVSAVTA